MKKVLILIFAFVILNNFAVSSAKEVPFTQDDRNRLIRLEEGQRSLEKQIIKIEERQKFLEKRLEEGLASVNQRIDDMNLRIDDMNQRIDNSQDFMLWGFGILFGGMGILIGFVIWDRRTALAPAIKKNKELEEREEKIERALKELAEKDPKIAEALKHVGLL